jgi:membrane protease YdiL (CAAX protease family)
METAKKIYWPRVAILFFAGFLGVLSSLPLLPQLVKASGEALPIPMPLFQALSIIQSSVILFAMVMLGTWLAPKICLGTPVLDAFLSRSWSSVDLRRAFIPAIVGGIIGGVAITLSSKLASPYLPQEFLDGARHFDPPFYTRILYGGITEEILMRWGLMTFFAWALYRCTQKNNSEIKSYNYLISLFLAAILFGVGHLPAAHMLSPIVTWELVTYIIVGNSLFGFIAGYLYWKKGLESAIVAHMTAHIVMVIAAAVAAAT